VSSPARPGVLTSAAQQQPVPLRRNSGFRMLWVGQLLSDTGSYAGSLAYPLLILALTHSPVIAGVAATVTSVVRFVIALPGGALVDRLDRRITMIVCDSSRAAVLAALGVLVLLDRVTWPVVLAVAVVDGAGSVLFDPAATAALPTIVADEQLEPAWAAIEGRNYAASLAGPALGGVLFGLGRAVPFLGDAVTYLISAGTVSRIRGQFRPAQVTERANLWRETLAGVALVRRHALLRAVVVQAPLINFAFTGAIFTITLALRRHGTAAGVIGLAQAGIMAGGLIGAIIAPKLQGKLSLWQLSLFLTVIGTAFLGLAAMLLPSPFVAVPIAVTLLVSPVANAALFAAMLRAAPADMRGRVTSTVITAATGLAAVAPLVAGLLVEHFSGRIAMLAFAAALGVAAVLCVALPGLRAVAATDV
jgi:MFS family permease